MAAILKSKMATTDNFCANANIVFWIPHSLKFPKMYRVAIPHETAAEIHEPDCRLQQEAIEFYFRMFTLLHFIMRTCMKMTIFPKL